MLHKYIRTTLLASLLAMAGMSCVKENIDTTIVDPVPFDPPTVIVNRFVQALVASPNTEGLDLGCFTIGLPFSMSLSDGGTVTIETEAKFEAVVSDSTVEIVNFLFPLEVTTLDGASLTVQNMETLVELYAACVPDYGWSEGQVPAYDINLDNSCFALVYPVTLRSLDNELVVVSNVAELTDLIASDTYFFELPLELRDANGSTVVVSDPDEMGYLLTSCFGGPTVVDSVNQDGIYLACMQLLFPIQVILPNGSTATISDADAYFSHLYTGWVVELGFPMTLAAPDSTTYLVEGQAELIQLLVAQCGLLIPEVFILFSGTESCFDIQFPMSVFRPNGAAVSLAGMEELEQLITDSGEELIHLTLRYPITVTLRNTGEVTVLESLEALLQLLTDCGP